MIKMIFLDHNYEYDLTNLYKMFYPNEIFQLERDATKYETFLDKEKDCYHQLEKEPLQEENYILADFRDNKYILKISMNGTATYEITIKAGSKKDRKNQVKRFAYDSLSDYTGKSLEWGVLTGIRPTKIVMECLEEGMAYEEIRRYLREEYYLSEEKIEIMLEITSREYKLLSQIDEKNSYSLYVGIPFCPTKCLYCSFTSYPIEKWNSRVDDYITALIKELREIALLSKDKQLVTIYIGGGTPTSIEASQLERILQAIKDIFPLKHLLEYTVEAGRPDTITRQKLEVIKKHGGTRLSINPQTMQQKTLDLIGRKHSVEETLEAYALAKEVGFTNINMDLIIGLPEETSEDMEDTLKKIDSLSPENLTVHALALKRASRLAEKLNEYSVTAESEAERMQQITWEFAKKKGLQPYYLYRQKSMVGNLENIGYSVEGKECIYNILIMEERHTIMAAGAGAATKHVFQESNLIHRVENVKSVEDYITRVDEMIDRKRKSFSI